ncbi:hypothetical protein C0J52_02095 [Blattella germanica]|nr:hypothetical protein C0J52_02095 [Blattella germanica]
MKFIKTIYQCHESTYPEQAYHNLQNINSFCLLKWITKLFAITDICNDGEHKIQRNMQMTVFNVLSVPKINLVLCNYMAQ